MNSVMKEMIRKRTDELIVGIVAIIGIVAIKGFLIEMKELLDEDPVDLKAIEKKLKQIENVRSEIQLTLIKAGEGVKSILTPDQRKKFKAMLKMGIMMREQPNVRHDS